MTPRFRALLRIAAMFALAGIPVGIINAFWAAWRLAPTLGDGSQFWSLAIGFAVSNMMLFASIFGLMGVFFGLLLAARGRQLSSRSVVLQGGLLGLLAGAVAGVAAFEFGGWGAGEGLTAWLNGAAGLGLLGAIVCGALATACLAIVNRVDPPQLRPPSGTSFPGKPPTD